ncbi:DUF1353 domain-containing protein [Limimaricola pyoseonensis]|uniref:DUF1353 domain-containing protein n=1 Tax=Limimaricola pyoseonensis TaxID=521013 RepID=A0A1G7GP37_9RHOB|nr:DUF1353 domain-containing protein [Limimaricola pyoseonensis]SDE89900.1 Protein of unknown function [Limimaricola pyoseonensis]
MSVYTNSGRWAERIHGICYRVVAPVRWEVGRVGSGLWLEVPAGRVFDVSVPRLARCLFSPHDPRFRKAAALHDEALHHLGWSRLTAGAEFAEALRADGVGGWRLLVMWAAVSLWRWR